MFVEPKQSNMSKDYFTFKSFEDLQVGDVFKFSPVLDNDIPAKFFTVYQKNETSTKFNSTYGKVLYKNELANDTLREVMVFPNR